MKKYLVISLMVVGYIFLLFTQTQDPYQLNPDQVIAGMSQEHIFGTDYLGRDLFSRMNYGGLYSILLAMVTLLGVIGISVVLGGIAGVVGGFFDVIIMLIADTLVSLPSFILALVFAGFFSNSILTVILALTISWSGKYIRYIRNLIRHIRKEEYILLAPLRGSFGGHTFFYHMLPNLFLELISLFMTDLGKIILSISGLSFLGIGVKPPIPELGTILYDGKGYFFIYPGVFIFPGLLLSIIILSTHSIGRKLSKKWGVNP